MDWNQIMNLVVNYSTRIIFSIIILFLASFLIKFIKKYFIKILSKSRVLPELKILLSDIFKFFLWILTFAIILNIFGLKEISIALGGSLVIIGVGTAKSISNIVSDLIAGFFLIFDDDFRIGYWVSTNQVKGRIESIEIRKTKIRDADDNLHIIPNKDVDGKEIIIKKEK